jgi:hypothetical protein
MMRPGKGNGLHLSSREDACRFSYGWYEDDYRQVNIREEPYGSGIWVAYVGGEKVGAGGTKSLAEQIAVSWIKANPVEALAE